MLNVDNIEYTIIRSARRTISIEVTKNLDVLVRAPKRMKEQDIEAFAARHADWLVKSVERMRAKLEAYPEPDAQTLEQLRRLAKKALPERVAYYSAKMNLTPAYVKITSAKTRFGSCNGKNGICFSCRLMQYPPEAVDYVVVHELAHIVHKNHQAEFYSLIESVLPDYRERRALLKE